MATKIKLIQTGGFAGIKKEAQASVDWTEDECATFLNKSAANRGATSAVRDGFNYTIEINNQQVNINPDTIQGKYKTTIDKLKKNLAIVKT